jgi:3-methylcrotonyl-CoA carboxylase alpha subunit
VEFIVDQSAARGAGAGAHPGFYFMEMNTRLQVEHPVTEMITGLDLVEWQLRVAAGEPLPLKQEQIPLRGHAIEVRVYAEEPEKGFLPAVGRLGHFRAPAQSASLRIDSGVEQDDVVSPHYDPMLAKLIVWDETRERAIARMLGALDEFEIAGVGNNLAFLRRLVDHPEFRQGLVDTGLIERERAVLIPPAGEPPAQAYAAASLWMLRAEAAAVKARRAASSDPYSPWGEADGWRINGGQTRKLEYQCGESVKAQLLQYGSSGVLLDGEPAQAESAERFTLGTQRFSARIARLGEQLHVFSRGVHHRLRPLERLAHAASDHEAHGGLVAPMPGKIVALAAPTGTEVEKGAALVVMEAMKMEHTLVAPAKGRVKSYLCAVGEQVKEGVELVEFEAGQ